LKYGATDYVLKPINTHILKEKIVHWISRRQHETLLRNFCQLLENKVKETSHLKDVMEREMNAYHPAF